MILYFSGTGNSAYIAKRVAEISGDEPVSMNKLLKERHDTVILHSEKPFVFVTPTYAWRMPRIIEAFIRRQSFEGCLKAYFILNCGSETGNAASFTRKLSQEKGFEYMGFAELIMPENYVTMFKCPDEEKAKEIIAEAEPKIDQIAQKIAEKIKLPDYKPHMKIMSAINPIFYSVFVKDKRFYAEDNCTSCGRCVRLCPLNNIELDKTDGKPRWHGNCTHCMACICGCPETAIEYGRRTKGKTRYFLDSIT